MTIGRARTYMAQDARRLQLLELGLHLFGARSYDDVSIDDIARDAEISRGLMYHYFGSKRGFYLEVVRHASGMLLEHIQPDSSRSAEENLRAGLTGFFAFTSENAQAYLTMLHGGLGFDDEVRTLLEEVRDEIVGRMLNATPYLDASPLLRTLARGWLSSVETSAQRMLQARDVDEVDLINHLGSSLVSILGMVAAHADTHIREPWHVALHRAADAATAAADAGALERSAANASNPDRAPE